MKNICDAPTSFLGPTGLEIPKELIIYEQERGSTYTCDNEDLNRSWTSVDQTQGKKNHMLLDNEDTLTVYAEFEAKKA